MSCCSSDGGGCVDLVILLATDTRVSPTLLMSESLWLPRPDLVIRSGAHKSGVSARHGHFRTGCLLIVAPLSSTRSVFLTKNRSVCDVMFPGCFIFDFEVLVCGEFSACAMCTSPLDVRTVTVSRLVCARVSGGAWEGVECSFLVLEFECYYSTML